MPNNHKPNYDKITREDFTICVVCDHYYHHDELDSRMAAPTCKACAEVEFSQ
jgi:hypothetical protein